MSGFPVLDFYSDGLPNSLKLLIVDSIQSPAQFLKQAIPQQHKQNLFTTVAFDQIEQDNLSAKLEVLIKSQSKPPLVIIDDLSSIIWAGDRSALQLIESFKSILPKQLGLDFSLILVFHDDLVKSNQRDRVIFNHLVNRSDIIIRTRAIGGQGQGELIVQRGPAYLSDLNLPITLSNEQTTQYKITDNSVRFHPKGLDRGFI
ncbi:hypothetical protein PSTT_12181 [Puccinia striiformis]|uniref:Elongator complex protein 5 n=1 Tax=Puccinia striiformis TaxID=27350 RepID=A0A2S4UX79_9BASI|nr:hypothetical protein PSTT_12181 [Puccinia striiformis]